jgi:hypothetical protein
MYIKKPYPSLLTPERMTEATLIHPSTTSFPKGLCEQIILTLDQTYWIPLHMSNEWLYTSPKAEIFTYYEVIKIPNEATRKR